MPYDPTELLTYHDSAYRTLLRFTGDEHLARDFLQEAYLKALHYADSGTLPNDPRAWLVTIAKNTARDYLSRQLSARSIDACSNLTAEEHRSPLEIALQKDELEHIGEVCRCMRPNDRDVLARFYVNGQGCARIGRELGITHSAAKARLHRARGRLRRMLEWIRAN